MPDQGKTVFFSSHILPDVERLCDRVGVIRNGQMEVTGTLHELLAGDKQTEIVLRGKADEEFLRSIPEGISVTQKDSEVQLELPPQMASRVNEILRRGIDAGFIVEHVMERGADLEALFTKGAGSVPAASESTPKREENAPEREEK